MGRACVRGRNVKLETHLHFSVGPGTKSNALHRIEDVITYKSMFSYIMKDGFFDK